MLFCSLDPSSLYSSSFHYIHHVCCFSFSASTPGSVCISSLDYDAPCQCSLTYRLHRVDPLLFRSASSSCMTSSSISYSFRNDYCWRYRRALTLKHVTHLYYYAKHVTHQQPIEDSEISITMVTTLSMDRFKVFEKTVSIHFCLSHYYLFVNRQEAM